MVLLLLHSFWTAAMLHFDAENSILEDQLIRRIQQQNQFHPILIVGWSWDDKLSLTMAMMVVATATTHFAWSSPKRRFIIINKLNYHTRACSHFCYFFHILSIFCSLIISIWWRFLSLIHRKSHHGKLLYFGGDTFWFWLYFWYSFWMSIAVLHHLQSSNDNKSSVEKEKEQKKSIYTRIFRMILVWWCCWL